MTEHERLTAAFLAGVEAHKAHRPRLYRGRDGVWWCPNCDPPNLRKRLANLAWKRRRR